MRELATIARHAGTVLAGQSGGHGLWRDGHDCRRALFLHDALAALSVASAVFVSVLRITHGRFVGPCCPSGQEQHGKGETTAIGASFRQSLYLAFGFYGLGHGGAGVSWTPCWPGPKGPESMQADVRAYLMIVGWALPSAMFFRLYTTLNQALGAPPTGHVVASRRPGAESAAVDLVHFWWLGH